MTFKDNHKQRFVVLGAGTAGTIAALYLQTVDENCKITIVKSDSVGILGSGEGTTPAFVKMMDACGIPFERLVRRTGATVKNGIRFCGWNKNNKQQSDQFVHSFGAGLGLGIVDLTPSEQVVPFSGAFLMNAQYGESPDKSDLTAKAAKLYKANFAPRDGSQVGDDAGGQRDISELAAISKFAVHFDANALAEELLLVAQERGIDVVEGKVKDFVQNEKGDVTSLVLNNDSSIPLDFLIDASGFSRMFPKAFKSKWVSWKKYLPVDSAIPFFLPKTKKIPAITDAIAMNYGWMWKIPLQHRWGCGYVFDSSLISAEEAAAEAAEFLGAKVEYDTVLTFEPGYYKTPWQRNVVSIGLASSFVEPLEATSIWATILQLEELFTRPEMIHNPNQESRDFFNKRNEQLQQNIAAMIQLHYQTRRKDTEFWQKFDGTNLVPRLAEIYDILKYRTLDWRDIEGGDPWHLDSWYYVGMGVKHSDMLRRLGEATEYNLYSQKVKFDYEYLRKQQAMGAINHLYDHRTFLELLGAEPWQD
jgi:tryptophan halogenase